MTQRCIPSVDQPTISNNGVGMTIPGRGSAAQDGQLRPSRVHQIELPQIVQTFFLRHRHCIRCCCIHVCHFCVCRFGSGASKQVQAIAPTRHAVSPSTSWPRPITAYYRPTKRRHIQSPKVIQLLAVTVHTAEHKHVRLPQRSCMPCSSWWCQRLLYSVTGIQNTGRTITGGLSIACIHQFDGIVTGIVATKHSHKCAGGMRFTRHSCSLIDICVSSCSCRRYNSCPRSSERIEDPQIPTDRCVGPTGIEVQPSRVRNHCVSTASGWAWRQRLRIRKL
mmetsp:Transcript_1994/g.2419  ORF Transcript_1994/g.2419 Transcript_1994/m.2419 type:complete len:278 (+) Transcript_1994:52-885(+)